jgi:hypothetical protein
MARLKKQAAKDTTETTTPKSGYFSRLFSSNKAQAVVDSESDNEREDNI